MDDLIGEYGVDVIGQFQSIEKLSGGQGSNENYRLNTSIRSYLLKYCDEKDQAGLESWLATLKHLEKHQFKTAYVTSTADGRSMVQYRGRRVVLFDFLKGYSPNQSDCTPKMMEEIGEALAAMHLIPLNPCVPSIDAGGCCMIFEMETTFVKEVEEAQLTNHEFVKRLKKESVIMQSLIHKPALPVAIIHTDVFPDNTLYDGESLVALVDFEEVCQGPALLDVGITLLSFCTTLHQEPLKGVSLDEALVEAFLIGYQRKRKLTDEEKELLAESMKIACMIFAFWRFRFFNVRKRAQTTDDEKLRYTEMTRRCDFIDQWAKKGGLNRLLSKIK